MTDQNAKQARETALTEGFHGEGEVTIAGHELRPFTFGSFTICRRLKLSLFTKEGAVEALTEEETMRQIAAFLWLQSQPPQAVLRAVREGTVDEHVERFQFDIPVHELPAIMRRINELSRLAGEAAVEIEEKPDAHSDSDAPKN